jgi:NADH dehydrogenase
VSAPHRVVILGGGFGGLYAAKSLKRAPVALTVLDRRNFHLFQPLLYQVATGALSPGEIASPLRSILRKQRNTRVLLGEAVDLDAANQRVICDIGPVEYDTLIVAAGARNFYFQHPEWEDHAPGLKTIEEATEIRHRILYAFEAAERESDPEKRSDWLTFVVVGAGPTGVELAGALGEIANDTLKNDFRSIRPQEARILLLDGSPRVLPPYPPDLSAKAERSLIRLGVRVRSSVNVVEIDESGVTLDTDHGTDRVAARTVIWAAGVHASPFGAVVAQATGARLDNGGRVIVNPDCTVPGHAEIFVIGDLAHFEQDGKPLTGVAQVAMQQGRYAARLIQERIRQERLRVQNRLRGRAAGKPFRYFDKGELAVIGRGRAVAKIRKLHLSGFIAWLIWLFIHLMYLVEFSNRLLVFVHWGFLYITFDRGARLITGRDTLPAATCKEETQLETKV